MTGEEGVVCVDVGGTSIKSGYLTGNEWHNLRETPTPKAGGEAVADAVAAIAAGFPAARCLGVSTAGEVELATGAIRLSDNIPGYTGLPLLALLRRKTGLPVAVENDVNAAALGELHAGAARAAKLDSFLMVSFGTGIGGAIVQDGSILRGAGGSAGEVGGLITHPEAVVPGDTGSGSYERYASTAALVARARASDPTLVDGRALFARLASDEAAARLVDGWLDEVSYGLAGAIHLLNPPAVLLGGGIMQQAALLARLSGRVAALLKPSFADMRLLGAALGNRAALYGAAYLVESRRKKESYNEDE